MANYYYVKNGGTATGDTGMTGTQRTGTWSTTASEYYDTIQLANAATTVPVDGDFIFVSDIHTKTDTSGSNTALNQNGGTSGAGVQLISVDDTNQDQYKPGGTETIKGHGYAYNHGFVAGLSLTRDANYFNFSIETPDGTWSFIDSEIVGGRAQDANIYGETKIFTNCILGTKATAASAIPSLGRGGFLAWRGGSISSANTATSLIDPTASSFGGVAYHISGVDLTQVSGTLFKGTVTLVDDGNIDILFENCTLHASLTLPGSTYFVGHNQRLRMFGCDDSTGDSLHRFLIQDASGIARNNDSTYVTATESWYEGTDKSSIEVFTTAKCSPLRPFIFELPAQYVDLSQAASDVLTLELTTDTALTLTDTDIAAFLVYPDGTTAVQPNWVTSGKTVGTGNYGIDPLAAGTTLTTGSLVAGDWTGEDATSPNFYKMVLDTSGDAGQATAVSIRIEVYKASIAAGTLFIHPLLTLS